MPDPTTINHDVAVKAHNSTHGHAPLRHVVMFKFKPEASDAEIEAWTASLQALPAHIGLIRLWQVGREISGRATANCEICLISGFDSAADLAAYEVHPAHLPIVTEARRLCSSISRTNFWMA